MAKLRHWTVLMELPPDFDGVIPMPFLGDYPGSPGKGRHYVRVGGGDDLNALEYAKEVFPEAHVVWTKETNILGGE